MVVVPAEGVSKEVGPEGAVAATIVRIAVRISDERELHASITWFKFETVVSLLASDATNHSANRFP